MKRGRGRPPHRPTPKDRLNVEVLAGFAIPTEKIAKVIGIDQNTLLKHYAPEIARGGATVEANLVKNLLRLAGGSDGTALKAIMFSLQCRFGWSMFAPSAPSAPPKPLGKKEEANLVALTAHEDTDWSGLVN